MSEAKESQKLRGGYYTPKEITNFICKWAINSINDKVLEPSCGDGNFIEACINRFNEIGISKKALSKHIVGVELIEAEAKKTKNRTKSLGLKSTSIVNDDFFNFISQQKSTDYNVIIGNPPFIRYQNFPEEHRSKAMEMMQNLGLHPNKLTNIWLPFLVISASILQNGGKLGMVIPAELFSVKYAAETRVFLSHFFERITIVTFTKLVFEGIQQEVVILLCEKNVEQYGGIRVIEFNKLEDLTDFDFAKINKIKVKEIDHSSEKWTKYFLEDKEINLLRRIKASKLIPICNDIMSVDVGIVTGRNEFFMLSQSDVDKWGLHDYIRRVVSKSNQLKGIMFSEDDFKANSDEDLKTYLFTPPNVDFSELPIECQKYIKYGEDNDFHKGYKCKIRKRWYITPSLWDSDAFALRQVNEYPKLILNNIECSSTDTIHRVRIRTKHTPKDIMLSFMNSLTFAFSEITGRGYGGGVLTFEPTEIEDLPIPITDNIDVDISYIDKLIREGKIDKALDIVDKEVLIKQYDFTQGDVDLLRSIWRKLSYRRINRKKK